jgi:hypothetical protein
MFKEHYYNKSNVCYAHFITTKILNLELLLSYYYVYMLYEFVFIDSYHNCIYKIVH